MLYTAEHLSLACLEILVHLDKSQMPRDYVWSKTELPSKPESLNVARVTWIRRIPPRNTSAAAGVPDASVAQSLDFRNDL